MLDRQIRLAGPHSQKAADVPAARIAWIEGESAIDQHDHRIDVLAETGESVRRVSQHARVVSRDLQGTVSKVDSLLPVRVPIRSGRLRDQMHATGCREAKGRAVLRVAGDGLLEQR